MKYIRLLSIAVVLFGFHAIGSAQTLQDVIESYNKGAALQASGDMAGAIAELEKCVDLAKKVGEEAEEQLLVLERNLPDMYLKYANDVNTTRDYPAALKALEATVAAAEKYNNPGVKEKAEKVIPQIYYALGATDYSAKKWSEAIPKLDQAIVRDPNSARSYFLLGACYQELKDEAKMAENYKLAMEKGSTAGDQASANNAKTKLFTYYYAPGAQAKNAQKWDEAISLLSKAAEVDDTNATIFQALSSCYNSKKNWDNAIANGEKALELNPKTLDGVYYELGTAYAGKNNAAKACEYFKKVENEPYLKGAKYQIEVALKCK